MARAAEFIANTALTATMLATHFGEARRFRNATLDPATQQLTLLKHILANNAQTEFGRRHGFESICGFQAYRDAVPVHSFCDLKPYIDKQRLTGLPSLTQEPPVMYNRTSGTAGEPKLIPVTCTGLDHLRRIQRVFAAAQFSGSPLYVGRILAVASPAVEGILENGKPCGSATGRIYATMPRLVRSKYVVPPELFSVGDYDARYYVIAVLGLRERRITGVAAANPSTFQKLLQIIRDRWDELIEDIANGTCAVEQSLSPTQCSAFHSTFAATPERAKVLSALGRCRSTISFADIWPELSGVVTWTGGSCGFALSSLAGLWPESIRIIEAGYVSSEFWGSINLDIARSLCVPALTSTVFEFVERGDWECGVRKFHALHEIEEGRQYYVFVTTPSGLYRYDMNDIVEVTGRFHATPAIAFVQKGRGITNITGEKLSEYQVIQALASVQRERHLSIPFFVAIADESVSQYRVYLEADGCKREQLDMISEQIDERLSELNIEYREKRRSGRLRKLNAVHIKVGTGDSYRKDCVARGQADGQFKVLRLQYKRDCRFDFERMRAAG